MNTMKNRMTRARRVGVWGLIALVLSAAVLNVSAFAPTTPLLGVANYTGVIDLGRRNTGASTDPLLISLTNSGVSQLIINSVSIGGANPGDFVIHSTTCNGVTLLPNGLCGVYVRMVPTAVGLRSARLVVNSNAPNTPQQIPLQGYGLNPSLPNRQVSATNPTTGFPYWYQDEVGTKLALCLDNNGLCLSSPDNPFQPASVTDSLINFPGEAFWWSAEAEIDRGNLDEALLVLAKEAAFTTEDASIAKQIAFDRVRVRIDSLVPGATYTVTYPFGVKTFVADEEGEINDTEDLGCGAAPCDFRTSLVGSISRFLRWDPAFAPAAPTGYLGDPNFPHRVTGSPTGNNIFKVDGPNVGGPGVNSIQTNLFSVSGKLW
jgi:hypothetical protein